jgi:hypothetical protein
MLRILLSGSPVGKPVACNLPEEIASIVPAHEEPDQECVGLLTRISHRVA